LAHTDELDSIITWGEPLENPLSTSYGLRKSRGGLASRLQLQRSLDEPCDSRAIFLLTERNQHEPFAYWLYDGYALWTGDAGPKRQVGERSLDLTKRAKRAEIVLSCINE
jgi:hypothetical protein